MGLFDKKFCDICGNKIGLLGNRKLDDGNLCKDCAAKLSPWFSERRHSTVAQISEQLAYREANKAKVSAFNATRTIGRNHKLLIDDNKKQFLEKMDSLIPWQDWVSIIDPIYYEGKVGQKPYPIELMLRIISRGSPQWGYYRPIQKSADKAWHR